MEVRLVCTWRHRATSSHIKIVYFGCKPVIVLKQNDISACSQIQKQNKTKKPKTKEKKKPNQTKTPQIKKKKKDKFAK